MDFQDLKFEPSILTGLNHRYYCAINNFTHKNRELMYNWCSYNLNNINGWNVLYYGITITDKDDAVLFQLRWC